MNTYVHTCTTALRKQNISGILVGDEVLMDRLEMNFEIVLKHLPITNSSRLNIERK